MIKDDDFLIINEYIDNINGILYRIQEAKMRSRYDNPGKLYGDTIKFYTNLEKDKGNLDLFFTKEDLWKRRKNSKYCNIYINNSERYYYIWDKKSIVNQVIYMWNNYINKDIYPSRLYLTSIVYAKVLSDWTEIDFYDLLSDNELLQNDKDWKNYLEDKNTYDEILCSIKLNDIYISDGMPKYDIEYCKKEFNL